jgi:RNA polymerase sigma-70 factor (ECF subfamily)
MPDAAQDATLIREYLDGNKTSFDALVLRYTKLVYSVALHFVKQPADAEDVTQDVFIKVLRNLKRFDAQKSFKPWVLQIARNQALDWLKKKKPLLLSELESPEDMSILDALPDPQPLPDAIVQMGQDADRLSSVVRQLSATERKVIFLRYIKQFSFNEIAEELHEVMDTVKSRHRRAIAKLRKLLSTSTNSPV